MRQKHFKLEADSLTHKQNSETRQRGREMSTGQQEIFSCIIETMQ